MIFHNAACAPLLGAGANAGSIADPRRDLDPALHQLLLPLFDQVMHLDEPRALRGQPWPGGAATTVMLVCTPLHAQEGSTAGVSCQIIDAAFVREGGRERPALSAPRIGEDFLQNLAHELRNPLAPLKNGLQILKLAQGDPGMLNRTREMMERQVAQMSRLVDDLSEISRLTRGTIPLERARVEVSAIIYLAIEDTRAMLDERQHELTIDIPEQTLAVTGDVERLGQVIANLLHNACKFTPRGGRIHIHSHAHRKPTGEEEIIIGVQDNGIGMSADMLPRVFDLFVQGERSLERITTGLGIGLALARRLVELHGGSIEARSEGAGLGSELVVRLPSAAPPRVEETAPQTPAATPVHARRRRHILIADDNHDAADTLATLLSGAGNDVDVVYDGMTAVEAANRLRPDIVLLDIAMPRLNGYEVAQRIRSQVHGRCPILIALTGFGQNRDRQKVKRMGFDAHLVKPVDYTELVQLCALLEARSESGSLH
ncbi:MAG: ATP-binding protein [Steroidobacteraceae bacterium]